MKKQKTETDSILENIADAVIENKKAHSGAELDPFEYYVQRVQSGIFSKEDVFRNRFVKGYHILLSSLQDPSNQD
jgi:hypothetical protein